jgi:hypothetical protein
MLEGFSGSVGGVRFVSVYSQPERSSSAAPATIEDRIFLAGEIWFICMSVMVKPGKVLDR